MRKFILDGQQQQMTGISKNAKAKPWLMVDSFAVLDRSRPHECGVEVFVDDCEVQCGAFD